MLNFIKSIAFVAALLALPATVSADPMSDTVEAPVTIESVTSADLDAGANVLSTSEAPSCKCQSSLGFTYQCAPIKKTCTGGPGMYQYACYVCPSK